MSWRPSEGWDAKKIADAVEVPSGFLGLEFYVEAGADAMLKVLMDEGVIYYGQLDWLQDKEDEVSEA